MSVELMSILIYINIVAQHYAQFRAGILPLLNVRKRLFLFCSKNTIEDEFQFYVNVPNMQLYETFV